MTDQNTKSGEKRENREIKVIVYPKVKSIHFYKSQKYQKNEKIKWGIPKIQKNREK